jgi:hypothetical protein
MRRFNETGQGPGATNRDASVGRYRATFLRFDGCCRKSGGPEAIRECGSALGGMRPSRYVRGVFFVRAGFGAAQRVAPFAPALTLAEVFDADVNHVRHQRTDVIARQQSARRQFIQQHVETLFDVGTD